MNDDDKQRKPITYEQACREQASPETLWTDAGIPKRFLGATIENYDTSDHPDQREVVAWAQDYTASFDLALAGGRGALLCGTTGTGKTHIATAVAKRIIMAGCSARYSRVYSALCEVKDTWRPGAATSQDRVISRFTKPDLLILDEIGMQFGSDAEKLIMFDILDQRYEDGRPTILVSNLNREMVGDCLGHRIIDRMRDGGGKMLVFEWASHRGREKP